MSVIKEKNSKVYYAAFIAVSLIFIAAFAVLTKLCPYTLDDWAWSGAIGDDRLRTLFDNYNGRYFGNFMILLISRNELAKIIIMSVSFYAVCLVPYLLSGAKRISILIFSGLTFVLLPRPIFAQIIAWASGYSNYMPPILLLAVYLLMIKNVFSDEKPKYNKAMPFIAFLVAVSAGLFMENVTLADIAIAFLVLIYAVFKHKRLYVTHVAFLVGSIVGAGIMFTNSAYGLIADSNDSYRSIAGSEGQKSIIDTIVSHFNDAVNQLFVNNIIICAIGTLLCIAICIVYLKNSKKVFGKFFSVLIALANVVSLVFLVLRYTHQDAVLFSQFKTNVIVWAISGTYAASLFMTIAFSVKDKNEKFKMLLILITVPTVVAPLLIVNPITARCYYPPYFMIAVLLVSMLGYLAKVSEESFKKLEFAIVPVAIAGIAVLSVHYYGVYSEIHNYDVLSREYIVKQVNNNEEKVYTIDFPNKEYLWGSNPANKLWKGRYKTYYGIPQETEVEYLQKEDFDKFIFNYDTVIEE